MASALLLRPLRSTQRLTLLLPQAAGAVPIAHNSGGPKSDIVKPNERGVSTGFLAATPEEYAKAIQTLFDGKGPAGEPIEAVREAGRQSVDRFSDEVFVEEFLRVAKRVL